MPRDASEAGRIRRQPGGNWHPDAPDVDAVITRAAIKKTELLPSGSNYVFAVRLEDDEAGSGIGIYKPCRGEAPLHDFPDGTLYRRERATYLLSEALGWRIVPPTVVRDGPHGVGMMQLFIEHRPRASYFTMREAREIELRRIAVFDAVVNNADRKGGHCLESVEGSIWGIDHGLTFHVQRKLRTVIWDYAGEPVDDKVLADLERLLPRVQSSGDGLGELDDLLHPREIQALRERIEWMLEERRFPEPPPWRPVPWPPL
jgi:uncharacterized repeat protein (TIGR03843 family)